MTDSPASTEPHPRTAPQPEDVAQTPATPAPSPPPKPRASWMPSLAAAAIALVAIVLILFAWRLPPFASGAQRTDDAYVRGQVTVMAPQVSGYIETVDVKDFDHVQEGQTLFQIDRRIYQQRVEQAKAALAAREADLSNLAQTSASRQATLGARNAEVGSARAQLARAQADMIRIADLAQDGSVSLRERDQATAGLRAAEAAVQQAQAAREVTVQDIASVGVTRESLVAAVQGARAALRLAEIDLANTRIAAPEAGQLGQVGARRGQYVTAGSQLVSIVPPTVWVIANFKERQAGRMAVGQAASVSVDALGDQRLRGHVEDISPATGSEFAVLPAQNATGNFTKIAQRLPIRIALNPGQPGLERLRPGMSVVARVEAP